MRLISKLFNYVLHATTKYNIDESHGLSHSMHVLRYSNKIFESELIMKPYIHNHERIIYISAILHDMCDKKYMNEKEGIQEIEHYLQDSLSKDEIDISCKIISTMSYSTVKKNGFPELHEYQTAYHIVREADLLSAYDFDRCMIYNMQKYEKSTVENAFIDAKKLFDNRIFMHNEDKLFITDFSKKESKILHEKAIEQIKQWEHIMVI
jgi:hypothetical protein